jgi:hypothetical protein
MLTHYCPKVSKRVKNWKMSKDTLKISYNICKASNANMGKKIKVSWQLTSIGV